MLFYHIFALFYLCAYFTSMLGLLVFLYDLYLHIGVLLFKYLCTCLVWLFMSKYEKSLLNVCLYCCMCIVFVLHCAYYVRLISVICTAYLFTDMYALGVVFHIFRESLFPYCILSVLNLLEFTCKRVTW